MGGGVCCWGTITSEQSRYYSPRLSVGCWTNSPKDPVPKQWAVRNRNLDDASSHTKTEVSTFRHSHSRSPQPAARSRSEKLTHLQNESLTREHHLQHYVGRTCAVVGVCVGAVAQNARLLAQPGIPGAAATAHKASCSMMDVTVHCI